MFYQFPRDITLEEVRSIVRKHNDQLGMAAFVEAVRENHVVFNYVVTFDGVFPTPDTGNEITDRSYAILRECRGLTFHVDGHIIARKFAKFFNVNEKPETLASGIDWSRPHKILEKLDGSMITPMWFGDPKNVEPVGLRWGTKMGLTDIAKPVEQFVLKNPQYAIWAAKLVEAGKTPLFEWCSRQQRIVIDYPEDRLVLTAIRDNATGEYSSYDEMVLAKQSGIDVVRALDGSVENIELFMAEAKDVVGEEGYIIRFDDGHMVKVKGAWYCKTHNTKDLLTLEKDALKLILSESFDDAKAMMDDEDRAKVDAHAEKIATAIGQSALRLQSLHDEIRESCADKKSFAARVRELDVHALDVGLLYAIYGGGDAQELVRRLVASNLLTGQRVNLIRYLIGGLRWSYYPVSGSE